MTSMTGRPLVVRITYHVVPRGFNGPITRVSCGYPRDDAQATDWVVRYAHYAARHFAGARVGTVTAGRCHVTRDDHPGPLATVEIEEMEA